MAKLIEECGSANDVSSDRLPPTWRHCLPQLYDAYAGICAYLCVYIERVTGARTTDHFVARSREPHLAYEWSNFRLACSLMNSRKGAVAEVLDPCEIEDGWFELGLPGFGVKPGSGLSPTVRRAVEVTIAKLGLDDWECRDLRRKHILDYQTGRVDLRWLERESPFVARELRRCGLLLGDGD
ncbi:MAG: hypothetical protein R6X02_14950 [Enhygromyxa sp.]